MNSNYVPVMSCHQSRKFIVKVPWLLDQPEDLKSTVRKTDNHHHTCHRKSEASCFNGVVPRPYSLVFIVLFLFNPALDSSKRKHILNFFIRFPRKFSISHKRVKFLQGTVIACSKNNVILLIVKVKNNFALIIDTLFHLKLV